MFVCVCVCVCLQLNFGIPEAISIKLDTDITDNPENNTVE